ncbi:ankyrin repeat and SAM domain-containing protein 1A-like [Corticium candelabrum]|uniref:ankyrin repeat and SAM domain-containing protein 1A-like n=1 Tax=Corticium candelabrum TaxID=121492 RepID=UPI002E26AD67|nr:ankyrin repeat and SAM domain-containing protein 1A-like [Corticium candelabrum]
MAAVHLAAIRGDLRMLVVIVESGGDITLLDNGFASPLYYAAKYGRIECVRYLLSKHKENELKTVTCHYDDVPLRQGYVEIVALLVTSGCHLEQQDPNGWTVLHAVCKRSNVEVVKTLLKIESLLKPSAIKHMITVVCDDGYSIHLACHYSNLDVIRLLISHHSPLNKFNSFGCTPLMVCCQSGQYQTVQLLLDAGADPNLVSPINKKTAMHWAANRRDLQRVWLLLQFGGD